MPRFELPITPAAQVRGMVAGMSSGGGGVELPIFYPASGEQVSTLVEDSPESVAQAVAAARRAFVSGPCATLSVEQRQAHLYACRQIILDHADELARLECAATELSGAGTASVR